MFKTAKKLKRISTVLTVLIALLVESETIDQQRLKDEIIKMDSEAEKYA